MENTALLKMQAVDKRFPGVHALDDVDFDVRAGEVHTLMGQNGAGKSTLIKVLTGVHPRDGGTITFEGRPFRASSPADAQRQGISTVYQEINLVPTLSVAENLFLGRARRRWCLLRWGVSALNACVRLLYGVRLSDEASCYKVFPTAVLRSMDLQCRRFEFCPEVTAKACRLRLKIHEVPIRYFPRTVRAGKKLRWRDGLEAVLTLWKYRKWSAKTPDRPSPVV